jgi:hypothetical protein
VRDDTRIVTAHEQAVEAAFHQLQIFAATRVRKNGQCTDRITKVIHDRSELLDASIRDILSGLGFAFKEMARLRHLNKRVDILHLSKQNKIWLIGSQKFRVA